MLWSLLERLLIAARSGGWPSASVRRLTHIARLLRRYRPRMWQVLSLVMLLSVLSNWRVHLKSRRFVDTTRQHSIADYDGVLAYGGKWLAGYMVTPIDHVPDSCLPPVLQAPAVLDETERKRAQDDEARLAEELAENSSAKQEQKDEEELVDADGRSTEPVRLLNFLAQTQYVRFLGRKAYAELIPMTQIVKLSRGDVLFRAGEPSYRTAHSGKPPASSTANNDQEEQQGAHEHEEEEEQEEEEEEDETERGMYIVRSGRLGFFSDPQPESLSQPLSEIGRGATWGEFILVESEQTTRAGRHSLTCVSLDDSTELFYLSRSSFETFMRRHPAIMVSFLRFEMARQWRIASFVIDHVLQIPAGDRSSLQGDVGCAIVHGLKFKDPPAPMRMNRPPPGFFLSSADEDEDSSYSTRGAGGRRGSNSSTFGYRGHRTSGAGSASGTAGVGSGRGIGGGGGGGIGGDEPVLEYEPRYMTLEPGEIVFEVGDVADHFLVIESGMLCAMSDDAEHHTKAQRQQQQQQRQRFHNRHATIDEETDRDHEEPLPPGVTALLRPGSVVGGMSFFGGTDRGETIRAHTRSRVLLYSQMVYEYLLKSHPDQLLPIVRAVASQLAPVRRQFVELGLQTAWFHSGEVMFNEGDESDAVFIVISGRVRMFSGPSVIEVGRGEPVGELGFIADHGSTIPRRTFTAVCVRDTRVVRMSYGCFSYILNQYPMVMMRFGEAMASRLRAMGEQSAIAARRHASPLVASTVGSGQVSSTRMGESVVTIALVPIDGSHSQYGLSAFGLRFASALRQLGPTLHLTRSRFDQHLGHGTADRLAEFFYAEKTSIWLTEQEEDYRFIVFEADTASEATAWSKCCVRHADLVMVVGRQGCATAIGETEHELVWSAAASTHTKHLSVELQNRLQVPRELVIIHPDPSVAHAPRDTRLWLKSRRVRGHHHVRSTVDDDYMRLARIVAGQAVALVLSGGGARGLAHLGVLRALDEAGIPVDVIGGSSQGAFMSALYAKHLDWRRMLQPARAFCNLFKLSGMVQSLTLPVLSYFTGSAFSAGIARTFNRLRIEDLWVRYFCITTNMTRNDMQVHQLGLLWPVVRASMSVVGYLPPVIHVNDDVLLDGGYLNNLPVDVMREIVQPGMLIAVDVENKDNSVFHNVYNYGVGVSGWWLLLVSYVLKRKTLATNDLFLWLSCMTHSRQAAHMKNDDVDLYIRPPVDKYALMDYPKINELVSIGYRHAQATIRAWKRQRELDRFRADAYDSFSTSVTPSTSFYNDYVPNSAATGVDQGYHQTQARRRGRSGPPNADRGAMEDGAQVDPHRLAPAAVGAAGGGVDLSGMSSGGMSSGGMKRNLSMKMLRNASSKALSIGGRRASGTFHGGLVGSSSMQMISTFERGYRSHY
eukprot:TRINITY_DN67184_c15_g12_i1.p1 TRINITY_DN67184_c15_g12~~TRINITY_DN67184_c15_g12_i1.p1  ORF type:complete len:1393 (+),score=677.77 TRINITY_DN67184_c15_g12_i1:35-4213(+)